MQQVTHYIKTEENELRTSLGTTIKSETLSDRDAGFCSGEETDLDTDFHHSPTDTSRDSSDTKDSTLEYRCSIGKNKRKCAEPRKVEDHLPPLKQIKLETDPYAAPVKEIKLEHDSYAAPCVIKYERSPSSPENSTSDSKPSISPFRPWSCSDSRTHTPSSYEYATVPSIPSGYVPPTYVQDEPLALVVEKKHEIDQQVEQKPTFYDVPESKVDVHDLRVNQLRPQEVVRIFDESRMNDDDITDNQDIKPRNQTNLAAVFQHVESNRFTSSSSTVSSEEKRKSSQSNSSQRNYKNMTRERRIEANARERTRVHTISAAFETLRKCVPAYANNQKLSKLSVLRIACSYIMTLSRIAGYDYSIDQSEPSIAECVDAVCNTIQMEGKTRKKKDE
ncbi:transcription factor Atoh8 [Planococcus citri]|uniref:transcription factor Atoh8 n=1 Tax=Planococcus citri TaxID=170843 RepID=UPI0031F73FBE